MDWVHLAKDRENSGLLWTQEWTTMFHKLWGVSWLAEELVASEEVPGHWVLWWTCVVSLRTPGKQYILLGHTRFLTPPFQFITHSPSLWDTATVIKQTVNTLLSIEKLTISQYKALFEAVVCSQACTMRRAVKKRSCCSRSQSSPVNMAVIITDILKTRQFTSDYGHKNTDLLSIPISLSKVAAQYIFKNDNWLTEIDGNQFKKTEPKPFYVAVRWKTNIIHKIICCNVCPVPFHVKFKFGGLCTLSVT